MRPKAVANIWVNGLAKAPNSDPLPFTTVAQKLNQGTHPKTGCFRFRAAFFRSFLAEQKEQ